MGTIIFRNSDVQTLPEITKNTTINLYCTDSPMNEEVPNIGSCYCFINNVQGFEIGGVFGIREGNYKLVSMQSDSGIYFEYSSGGMMLPHTIISYDTNLNVKNLGSFINDGIDYCKGQKRTISVVFEHTSSSGVKRNCNLNILLTV